MDAMDKALMLVGISPGGAYTDEQMEKYRNNKIKRLAQKLPKNCSNLKRAHWIFDNADYVVELIRYHERKMGE
jgi:hypothetical protein